MRKRGGGVVAMMTAVLLLGGCGTNRNQLADDMARRFVEQVNNNTCDDKSGFRVDRTTWTAACDAVVADLAPGTTLSAADAASGDYNSGFDRVIPYDDVDGAHSEVVLFFDYVGPFGRGGELDFISSESAATIGDTATFDYNERALDDFEAPDAKALIERVQSLLLSGQCPEITALMAPASDFDGAADTAQCGALAKLYAANPPTADDVDWRSSVYSVTDLEGPGTAYGVDREQGGEGPFDYRDRVLAEILSTNRKVRASTDFAAFVIEVVLHEGRWYVLNIEFDTVGGVSKFRHNF